jgi:L-serine/L-threonine ammonia-lyase
MKMEAMQPSGSFKMRGVGHARILRRTGAQRFISSSGGNAGLAVAYAGRKLGIPALIVVPETTSERARYLLGLRGWGEGSWAIVGWKRMSLPCPCRPKTTPLFIHLIPLFVWGRHATLIDEVASDGVKPDAVILSVGGGGRSFPVCVRDYSVTDWGAYTGIYRRNRRNGIV